ncbi:MAG: 4-O-beta-D-mannosyl-D-glucose phosphorylase [Saprospiraceae bacterium]|nr:MAG: 4-O-beta-D-mannosyl-D-glucose phosphorylase [Saprospiraceae bacterium]
MQSTTEFKTKVAQLFSKHRAFIERENERQVENNGIFHRYKNPVLTWKHTPIFWRYDLNEQSNPYLMERLEINTVFNAGAIGWNGKVLLFPRIESNDVKSFFGVAESKNGVDNFCFWDYPITMPETGDPDMNVYDMRVVEHEDGWIYGTFCTERKDKTRPHDTSAAIAQNGIARTKDFIHWERLPDLKTPSSQQRNGVLHPEFIDGQYAFYTRPMDGFIDTGGGDGIGWGLCKDIKNPVIEKETIIDPRVYHTVKEVKNGMGPAPLKTKEGWLHLAHGVRRTAAGLRYVLYVFLCDLKEPWRVIRKPGRHFIAPHGIERVGDVSNVIFSNGWVLRDNGEVFIYYASSDTRMHVATTTIAKLLDYVLNTPEDAGRTFACVQQRNKLIQQNLEIMDKLGIEKG